MDRTSLGGLGLSHLEVSLAKKHPLSAQKMGFSLAQNGILLVVYIWFDLPLLYVTP